MEDSQTTKQWIIELINAFTLNAPQNSLGLPSQERAFDTPLVAFSSGADELYRFYQQHIGPFYKTPTEFFHHHYPDTAVQPQELTVISWVIPSTSKTREEQASATRYPSERWARTRLQGEDFNVSLRQYVVKQLEERGIAALAPMLSPLWSRSQEGPYAPCSNWSERHAAYAAGLGTFGLCDGLITAVGKAVRVGSVIANTRIPADERPYTQHQAYCLHFTEKGCRACIDRCPVQAISEAGHDKQRCMQYTEHTMNRYIREQYGLDTYACGLCQADVPCTSGIPVKE